MKIYCQESRGLQPQACEKNNRIYIAAVSTLSLPCTHLTCLLYTEGEVGGGVVLLLCLSSPVHK